MSQLAHLLTALFAFSSSISAISHDVLRMDRGRTQRGEKRGEEGREEERGEKRKNLQASCRPAFFRAYPFGGVDGRSALDMGLVGKEEENKVSAQRTYPHCPTV